MDKSTTRGTPQIPSVVDDHGMRENKIFVTALIPSSLERDRDLAGCPTVEGSVTPLAGSKAGRTRQRLAGGDHLESAAHFVGNRLFLGQVPLPQCREPVGAHAGLREARDVLRQRDR